MWWRFNGGVRYWCVAFQWWISVVELNQWLELNQWPTFRWWVSFMGLGCGRGFQIGFQVVGFQLVWAMGLIVVVSTLRFEKWVWLWWSLVWVWCLVWDLEVGVIMVMSVSFGLAVGLGFGALDWFGGCSGVCTGCGFSIGLWWVGSQLCSNQVTSMGPTKSWKFWVIINWVKCAKQGGV